MSLLLLNAITIPTSSLFAEKYCIFDTGKAKTYRDCEIEGSVPGAKLGSVRATCQGNEKVDITHTISLQIYKNGKCHYFVFIRYIPTRSERPNILTPCPQGALAASA